MTGDLTHTVPATEDDASTEASAVADSTADGAAEGDAGQAVEESSPDAEAAEAAAESSPIAAEADPSEPVESHPVAEEQEIIAGTIQAVEAGTKVIVELQGGLHGVVDAGAFEKIPRIGTRLQFVIEHGTEDEKGRPHLHVADSDEKITWKNLEQGMIVDAMVTGMNVGGLELKIAGSKIRAFMPNSQIDVEPVSDPTVYLSHKLHTKVVSLERRRRRVVLSRRALIEKEVRKQKLKQIDKGEEREVTIARFETFGVLVDVEPAVRGLIRMGDLAWHHVDKASDVLEIGQKVTAKVLGVERGRVLLGLKQMQPNPWQLAAEKYPVGEKVKGKVTRTSEFGAFVELEPGVEGMIHISQLSERRVETVEQAVREGQVVEAKVMDFDARRHRIGLSIRALTAPETVNLRKAEASREDMKKYIKTEKKARAMESLMAKFGGGDGLKGGLG